MNKFLDCLCEEQYESLIIAGTATAKELREQWVLILSDYYDLKGDVVTTSDQLRLSRDITRLQNHLYIVQKCVGFLETGYSASIAGSLRKLGYSFYPLDADPAAYRNQLQVILNKSKSKYIQMQQLVKELHNLLEKIGDEKPQPRTV
jgi:hypothetical protein